MRTAIRPGALTLMLAAPLAAQTPPSGADLSRLAFMSGCWTAATDGPGGAALVEQRYTSPSENVMLGTTRFLTAAGRTVYFQFVLVRSDSSGTWMTNYPNGRAGERPFQLTRTNGDTAMFEAPENRFPKRIAYYRDAAGALVSRLDGGPSDTMPESWRMRPVLCATAPGALAAGVPAPRDPPGSGATELIVFETLHGLFLGLALPVVLEASDPAPFGLGLLLGGPTGLILSRAYARARQPNAGQARAIVWGGTWGALTSLFLYQAFEDQSTLEGSFGAMTAGLIGGTLFGGYVARQPISGGDATMAIHSTFWGGWVGLALGIIADDGGEEVWTPLLIGGNAGLLAASIAARKVEMSSGRVWIITAAGLAGGVAGIGLDILLQPDDATVAVGVPLLASLAGLALGASATRTYDAGRIASSGPRAGTLLSLREGRLRWGVPLPQPALVPRDDGRTRRWVPGLRIGLVELRH